MEFKSHQLVLHIDDDKDDRELIREVIESIDGNMALISVSNGVSGLAKLDDLMAERIFPCVIILDMNMPGMTGETVIKELKQHRVYRSIPLIVLSTSNVVMDDELFKQYNIPVMVKPHSMQQLQDAITEILEHCSP